MHDHYTAWDGIPEEGFPNGVTKRTLLGARASLVRVHVPAGTRADRHSHPFEQFVQVVSGSGVLETSQGERPFGPGSLFHFPPDTWHAARFVENTVLIESNLVA
jgi:quercetin dioxygenase-like cupin family protein